MHVAHDAALGAPGPLPLGPCACWGTVPPLPAGARPLSLLGGLGVAIDVLWCGEATWVHWDATGAAYLR